MDSNTVDNPLSLASSSASNGAIDEAEGIWSADIEQSFLEALAIYPPCGRRKIILTDEGKMYGRNELVARYIKIRTGKTRTRKQVSSHLQVLAKRRSKEIQSLRNDKVAQQVILDRLKRYTSAEIVSMNGKQMDSDDDDDDDDDEDNESLPDEKPKEQKKPKTSSTPIKNLLQTMPIVEQPVVASVAAAAHLHQFKTKAESISSSKHVAVIKKSSARKGSSTAKLNPALVNSIPLLLPTSPGVFPHSLVRSRCSSNTSSSSPLSSGSTGSQTVMMNNPPMLPFAVIGDENFRLYELNAFAEIKRSMSSTHVSLIYPSTENYNIYQHDLLRLHGNDIQMKTIHPFETISVDQIFDKFPRHDGLKDLFEHNPDGPFFLIKFWADVSIPSSMLNLDESFFTTYTYVSSCNRPIHISTRLCSFGQQVLVKGDTSEHPQHDQFDQYIHRFDRSALCDYMVQFIQKLRSLPKAYMMNSVLENFTVLQVIKCLDNPERLLLCLGFVFEIATLDAGGSQYQVYKLVAN